MYIAWQGCSTFCSRLVGAYPRRARAGNALTSYELCAQKFLIEWCSLTRSRPVTSQIKNTESVRAALGALGRWDAPQSSAHTHGHATRPGRPLPVTAPLCRRMHVREIGILFDRLSGCVGHAYVCVSRYESRHYESRAMTAGNVRMSGGPIGGI